MAKPNCWNQFAVQCFIQAHLLAVRDAEEHVTQCMCICPQVWRPCWTVWQLGRMWWTWQWTAWAAWRHSPAWEQLSPPFRSPTGLQRDVVFLCWPIAPTPIESQSGGMGGGVVGPQPMSTVLPITWHGAQINFGDLPPCLTYEVTLTAIPLKQNFKTLTKFKGTFRRDGSGWKYSFIR
jgi:hypothetical protein